MFRKIFVRFTLAAFLLTVSSVSVFAAATLTGADAVFLHQQACNFGGAWDKGYSGNGITVGIIDDSMQMDHPAYSARVINGKCKFFVDGQDTGTGSSNPRVAGNNHGTAVAGCIAANSGTSVNVGSLVGTGIVAGAAYNASLIGVGFDLKNSSITSAYNYIKDHGCSVINNSYGMTGGFATSGGTGAGSLGLVSDSDATNAIPQIHEAAQKGSIILFSAGNSRQGKYTYEGSTIPIPNQQDANKKAYQACVDTLTIAATENKKVSINDPEFYNSFADFSCYGSNVFACAPGKEVVTSDRTGSDGYTSGDYYDQFDGTSASSPVAAGVVALGVEALKGNSNVTTVTPRLMKHLLVQTCDKIDTGSSNTDPTSAWTTNGAGIQFSPTYGFGQVNAGALVTAAETTLDVTTQTVLAADWTGSATTGGATCTPTVITTPREIYWQGSVGTWPSFNLNGGDEIDLSSTAIAAENGTCLTTMGYTSENVASTNNGTISTMGTTDTQTFYATFSTDTFAGVTIQPLEEVTLTIFAETNYKGDIQIELTSPSQTKSILCYADDTGNVSDIEYNDLAWTFSSNAFWGENPEGEWKVEVKDKESHDSDDTGVSVKGISTTFYMGEIRKTAPAPPETPVPEPGTWVLLVLGTFGVFVLKRRGGG